MKSRGVSPVVGIALLLGFTAIVALSMLLLGATAVDDGKATAETTGAERSMGALAADAERLTAGETDSASFAVEGSDRAGVGVDPTAGAYEVRIERPNGTEVLSSGDIGAYRYRERDGTTVAFQGGGVWQRDDGEEATVVRPPAFHYRADPEPTLTLPVVRLAGGDAVRQGRVVVREREAAYPDGPSHRNPLEAGRVFIEVTSEYCAGWETHFRDRTEGAVVESCGETGRTAEGTVLVRLSVPFTFDGLGDDAVVANQVTGQGSVYGSTSGDVDELESASGVVEHRVERCADGEGQALQHSVSGGGTYCASSMAGDYEIDTRGDEVEIVVDGRVDPDELRIRGDGVVTLFAREDVLRMPADDVGNASRPEQLRIVVHSDAQVGELPGGGPGGGPGGPGGGPGAGNLDLYALVYAPNSLVSFSGNAQIHGGVVAERLHLQSASSALYGSPDVGDVTLEYEQGGEPFYYLHVSETTVSVEQ